MCPPKTLKKVCPLFPITYQLFPITYQSGHHFALWTLGRSDRFNIGLTRNAEFKKSIRLS